MRVIDLNADLGEGGANDAELIALVSSANIACGGHAGDESTMRPAMDACLQHAVAVGAHPGYEDPEHFGRRPLDVSAAELDEMIARQFERFARIADQAGAYVHHVKPHGALYHQADLSADLANVFARRVAEYFPGCAIYHPPAGMLADAAVRYHLRPCVEGFADRRYMPDGKLVPRSQPGAVIEEIPVAISQALALACGQRVPLSGGNPVNLLAQTLCVHGDGPRALEILRALRGALIDAGVSVCAP